MGWIKFDTATPEKPEVMAITLAMGYEDPDLTVGKLIRVWRWFDQHTLDGNAASVTSALLDRMIGAPGMCAAMQSVGWLDIHEGGIRLPNFARHNGKTAKDRVLTAQRVAKAKSGNAASVSGALPREEKRRINTSPPKGGDAHARAPDPAPTPKPLPEPKPEQPVDQHPQAVDPPGAADPPPKARAGAPSRPDGVDAQVWADWLALRRSKRAPVTATTLADAQAEAGKAGMSLEAFLREWCGRGSQGLRADWLQRDGARHGGAGPPAAVRGESYRERDRRVAAERVAEFAPQAADRKALRSGHEIIDVGGGNVIALARG